MLSMSKNQCDGCQARIPVDENGNHRMGKPGGYPDLMGCQAYRYKKAGQKQAKVEDIANRLVNLVKNGGVTSHESAMDFLVDETVEAGIDHQDVFRYLENRDDLDFNIHGEYCARHRTLHDCGGEEEQ